LSDASRFVESLLLGLPVPGIFLSKEEDTQKLLVIDGQQRLRTLQYFYNGVFEPTDRRFALRGVQQQFEGATYKSLADEDRRRLDDSILHATVVKQDEPSDDESSIYHIFERLNTSGRMLHPQEIRKCVYHGEFVDLLEKMNANEAWRSIYGHVSKRMRDQELILRFLALYFDATNYKSPMKEFLNTYMGDNRDLSAEKADEHWQVFQDTIGIVFKAIGQRAFRIRTALNAAVFDAVMIGVARRLDDGPVTDIDTLQARYTSLLENDEFMNAASKATSNEDNVYRRLALAQEAFRDTK
jgi:hypothetical protein